MKRIGLFLLAVVMVGVVGCGGDGDSPLSIEDLAGVYTYTKLTITEAGVVYVPPIISGTINLTSSGAATISIVIDGVSNSGTGTFVVSDPTIVFTWSRSGRSDPGTISDGGRKITIIIPIKNRSTGKEMASTNEFTRS